MVYNGDTAKDGSYEVAVGNPEQVVDKSGRWRHLGD